MSSGSPVSHTPDGDSGSLTAAQKRHLAELQRIARGSTYNTAVWTPANGGEHRCAAALAERGFLTREYGHGIGGRSYSLTAEGREVRLG